ncbi:hypothetical protein [Bosea sp. BH3]|uniref:hypothetical protein n=1 Tax=Bosea sp. BH3 TaxID=2871701 RepID=UPI0021CB6AA7|nr:hypothetical protein [Bosea sp. BH3]MCU4181509.1 hypothetical protein [Bosea sp. BH3]
MELISFAEVSALRSFCDRRLFIDAFGPPLFRARFARLLQTSKAVFIARLPRQSSPFRRGKGWLGSTRAD